MNSCLIGIGRLAIAIGHSLFCSLTSSAFWRSRWGFCCTILTLMSRSCFSLLWILLCSSCWSISELIVVFGIDASAPLLILELESQEQWISEHWELLQQLDLWSNWCWRAVEIERQRLKYTLQISRRTCTSTLLDWIQLSQFKLISIKYYYY